MMRADVALYVGMTGTGQGAAHPIPRITDRSPATGIAACDCELVYVVELFI
jgi:hypothetical protein